MNTAQRTPRREPVTNSGISGHVHRNTHTEAIDTTSSAGRLVFHIFGALAEFERNLIRERTVAGLKAARARGRKGGRKPALSRGDVRRAAAMLADPTMTKTEVARYLGVSRVTLNVSLRREGY